LAIHLFHIRPRVIRLDAGYWGLRLIRWIHSVLGAVAVLPWDPKRAARIVPACLPLGRLRSWANAVPLFASSVACFSFSISNVRLSGGGRPSSLRLP
jgi:hypothetical protein